MNRLRVLHFNSLLTGGGTDDRGVRTAHALMQLGYATSLAGPADREFSSVVQQLGIPFHPLPTGKLRSVLRLARLIRQERIDILHARHGRDYWPAIIAARLSAVRPKLILSRHLASSPASSASRRFLLGQCDALVAVSNFVAKVLREGDADPDSDNPERHYRPPLRGDYSKIHVVYGGFDMQRFRPFDATEQRRAWRLEAGHYAFAVIGRYNLPRGKGQPEFLRAAARIRTAVPNARFLIIGRGNMREQLQAQIEQLGLQDVAWLTPYCHDVPAGMNAIDCLVLPQVGTEAFGGVVVEAHACGRPVIASDLDGIPEPFGAAGYGQLVKRGDIEALASAMRVWARTPPLEMAARWELHERVARRFSLDRSARDLADVYETVFRTAPLPVG